MKLGLLLIAGALAFAAMPATALPIIDVSMSVGVNRSSMDSAFEIFAPGPASESVDGSEPRITLNASLTSLFGLEAGWTKLGSRSGTITQGQLCPGSCPPGTPDVVADVAQDGSAMWLAYAPSIRIGSFALMGKIGAARVEREAVIDDLEIGGDQTEVLLGAAGTWWFADSIGLRADVERVGSDVNQVGLSLTVGF